MPAFLILEGGGHRYAVNPDRVAFVCVSPDGKTRIFFSGWEEDYILVDDAMDTIIRYLQGKV